MSATLTANWDLTPYFPAFDGPEYRTFRTAYAADIEKLTARAGSLGPLAPTPAWTEQLLAWEKLGSRAGHLSSYLECLRAADGRDEAVAREYAGFHSLLAEHKKLDVVLLDALRQAGDAEFAAVAAQPELAEARFRLERLRHEARLRMSAELETLAAELEVDGLSAWGRLYDQIAGTLEFELTEADGTTRTVPMSLKNSLLENPDPALRRSALQGSNRAWEKVEHTVAACLNAIAGTRLALYRRRGIGHFLEPALFDSAVSSKTLDAMLGAIAARYEVPRDYLRLKAKLLGKQKLGFQDLSAPLPLSSHEKVTWDQARGRIESVYGERYPALGDFCRHAFERRWIDYDPRPGKRPGGFCTGSEELRESRIFMTFNQTTGDVQTLAHELGHAFHSWVMRDLRPWAAQYPMTLAETASTFAETLLTDAILAAPETSDPLKAVMLDTRLEGAAAFLLNIPMRFLFEKRFYEERAAGEVSVSRLKALLLEAQRETYGDTLDPEELDPMFWASKLHFYITEVSFYNFPYSFGFLFSLGVYARARQEGPSFFKKYEELLRLTGSDTAENVARSALGVDLEAQDFWLDSIALVAEDLQRFQELVPKVL